MLAAAIFFAFSPQPDPATLHRIFEDALARRERQYGLADARTAQAARDLGMFLTRQGDAGAARTALAEAVRIDEQIAGVDAADTLRDIADLAAVSPPREADGLWRRAAEASDPAIAVRALLTLGESR